MKHHSLDVHPIFPKPGLSGRARWLAVWPVGSILDRMGWWVPQFYCLGIITWCNRWFPLSATGAFSAPASVGLPVSDECFWGLTTESWWKLWSKEVGKQSSQIELWDHISHNTTFMKGGVRLYITEQYIHEGWCETLHHKQYIHDGWCDTVHHITIHLWRPVWDFKSHNNAFMKGCFEVALDAFVCWDFLACFGVCGCRSQWHGCMIGVS